MLDNVIEFDFKNKKRSSPKRPDANKATSVAANPFLATEEDKLTAFSDMVAVGITNTSLNCLYPGVKVPEHLSDETELVLAWSLKFGVTDFDYNAQGICGTLSFNRQPFFVSIPWGAVWMMQSTAGGTPKVWPASLPGQDLPKPQTQMVSDEVDINGKSSAGVGSNLWKSFFRKLGARTKRILG